jgi:hypothetical protein
MHGSAQIIHEQNWRIYRIGKWLIGESIEWVNDQSNGEIDFIVTMITTQAIRNVCPNIKERITQYFDKLIRIDTCSNTW